MLTNILDYLRHSAEKHGDKTAFSDGTNSVTYRGLDALSDSIASFLMTKIPGKNEPAAVLIDRNIQSVVSFMGIVKSGNFYVPVDSQLPPKRIALIFETLKPKAVIFSEKNRRLLESLDYEGTAVLYEDAAGFPPAREAIAARRRGAIDTDPLYAIFTSGSTGVPKGVVVSHRSVIDLIENFAQIFDFQEDCVFGNQAPFDFDVSVKDIYSTLKCGGRMHIIPKLFFSFPGKLITCINEQKINTIIWAVSALRIIENFQAFEKERPKTLRTIMFSGETMPCKVLNYWQKNLPDAHYVNLYGPTEITCNCTYYKVDRHFLDTDVLPIGIPFPNTDILLLDKNHLVTDPDVTGEICVRGTSLALGYYQNPAKTAEVFCQNPCNNNYPERIYRTGDLGRRGTDGLYYFLSRKDDQIKHMGHRIELGEVEAVVSALPFIHAACCLYHEEKEAIVLFYQSAGPCQREILKEGGKMLPKYMLPSRFVHFHSLPMTKNGKIDRTALKEDYL